MTETGSAARSLLAGLVLALLAPLPAAAQLSPGPLSRAHRDLEGNLHCLKCHGTGGERRIGEQCLACHKEIRWLIDQRRGYHGREARDGCATCHPEHAGESFDLVRWPEGRLEAFDHGRTGWRLEGRHARLKCAACHERPEFRKSPAASLSPRTGTPRGYTGLEPGCASCHADIHGGALGPDCASCHRAASFEVPNFDHGKTSYPLAGKHREVPCAKCHLAASLAIPAERGGRRHPLLKPLPHGNCADCHRDPHAGSLGAPCARCHTEQGFREVRTGSFDHDRTRYPLRGRHTAVPCAKCHAPAGAPFNAKPAFDRCAACHADAHAGQDRIGGQAADCGACHSVEAYSPSTFTVERHDASPYPLAGRHRKVACRACHPGGGRGPGRAGVLLRPARARCDDCHADPHGGQARGRADGGDCALCHDLAGFRPSTFDAARHAATPFPLAGRHTEIACSACHGPSRPGLGALADAAKLGRAGFAFHPERECVGCHFDPHGGRYLSGGDRPAQRGCLSCHDAKAFRPASIDADAHAGFGFDLAGAHRKVACVKCHQETSAPPSSSSLILAPGPRRALLFAGPRRDRCESCHADPHGGQFARRKDGGACSGCHGLDAFRPAVGFDHERDTRFPLKGAHASLTCQRCHRPAATAAEGTRALTVYAGLPTTCAGCHGKPVTPSSSGGGSKHHSAP